MVDDMVAVYKYLESTGSSLSEVLSFLRLLSFNQLKKKSGSLEYCNKCQDQSISGINNEGLMSKIQNMGRRDKTTRGMVYFKTMLQVAKNFWQLEKAKAIMQQAYVPRANKLHKHKDTPKSEQK